MRIEKMFIDNRRTAISSVDAYEEYKRNCIKYFNNKIHVANKKYKSTTNINKEKIFPSMLEDIRIEYKVVVETKKNITISWH